SDCNQYIEVQPSSTSGTTSSSSASQIKAEPPLDIAFNAWNACGPDSSNYNEDNYRKLFTIMGILLVNEAIECRYPEKILELGLKMSKKTPGLVSIKKVLANFAVSHDLLTAELLPFLIKKNTEKLDWSRKEQTGHAGYKLSDELLNAVL